MSMNRRRKMLGAQEMLDDPSLSVSIRSLRHPIPADSESPKSQRPCVSEWLATCHSSAWDNAVEGRRSRRSRLLGGRGSAGQTPSASRGSPAPTSRRILHSHCMSRPSAGAAALAEIDAEGVVFNQKVRQESVLLENPPSSPTPSRILENDEEDHSTCHSC